ncbi:MAG: aldehyde dehydrogenase family protein [Rhodoferax sp.]|nr:aldehyde dehydrogenase family protein [Rhodoferax sp.]
MNTPFQETDLSTIQAVFEAQAATALSWRQSTAAQRIERLERLRTSLLAHQEALHEAFFADFHKPRFEVDGTELVPSLDEIRHNIRCLKRWMRPTRVRATELTLGTRAHVQYQPRGRCLIIAPWNYPLYMMVSPLVSALAAGNTAILKPSEMAPRVAQMLASILAQAFAPQEVALVEGGVATSQALLALPFDHIFFTGSPAVGKVVMAAAAKNLSSVTLELGGKSPAIVDETADIQEAARVLLWGKFVNAGQTCIAPDYLYVHASVKDAFVAACQATIRARYGDSAQQQRTNPDFTHIINQRHTQRIQGLLEDATTRGARVLCGAQVDTAGNYVAPTLLDQVPMEARVMQEEIFGPVLPIIAYTDLQQVIAAINAEPKPLALYVWSRKQSNIDRVLTETSSGGACVNHCVVHIAHGNLPFGGVNNSGIGSSHGIYGFKAFSHERAVLKGGWVPSIRLFFPPYTAGRAKLLKYLVHWVRR